MTHFFNNKKVLMENVLFQDLTPKALSFQGYANKLKKEAKTQQKELIK